MADAPTLGSVVTHGLDGPVVPFGVAIAADSRRAFVSDAAGAADVLSLDRRGVSLARHDGMTFDPRRCGRGATGPVDWWAGRPEW